MEGSEALSVFANPQNLQFLQTLKDSGTTSTITLAGDVNAGPNGPLKSLFSSFDTYFNGVNLMLYSTDQYYLDADNASWGISQWLSYVGNDPSKLSIGFYDSIPYEMSSANATQPSPYDVTGLSRGEAAAKIYLDLCTNLHLTPNDFAAPFWWTDNPTTLPQDEILQDFYHYLAVHSPVVAQML